MSFHFPLTSQKCTFNSFCTRSLSHRLGYYSVFCCSKAPGLKTEEEEQTVSLLSLSFSLSLSLSLPQGSFVIRQEDVSISYLPLAHMFERMIQVTHPPDPPRSYPGFPLGTTLLFKPPLRRSAVPRCPCSVTGRVWASTKGTSRC